MGSGILTDIKVTRSLVNAVAPTEHEKLEDIRKNNRKLTDIHKKSVHALGFNDFYDMYLTGVAEEQEHKISKGGNKDLSKLTPIEQTVIRNGKPTKMKIYVDKNKEQDDDEPTKNGEGNQTTGPIDASVLVRRPSFGNIDSKAVPRKVAELKEETLGWDEQSHLDANCADYLEGRDSDGNLRFLAGFTLQEGFLVVSFMISDGSVSGYQVSTFYELIKWGLDFKLGVKYPNLKTVIIKLLAEEYSMTLVDGFYSLSFDELIDVVG